VTLVVDASVAVKFGVKEAGAEHAKALVARGEQIIAPDILASEVVSALWKKGLRGDLGLPERGIALAASLDAYDEFAPCKDLAERALELAIALKHPVYDCFYLALAEARDATFVTADARLLARLEQGGWEGKFEAL
jgi:predicted nucleic acid-binding protein